LTTHRIKPHSADLLVFGNHPKINKLRFAFYSLQ
jgi:hypothetical protein